MKEELQSKLVEILGSIQTAAGKAGDFALAQLPDIAQSYVAYGRAYTTIWAFASVIIFFSGFYFIRLTNRKVAEGDAKFEQAKAKAEAESRYTYAHREQYFEWDDIGPLPYLPFVVGVLVFGLNLSQLLLVWFAPKVWLLKEIAWMVRS